MSQALPLSEAETPVVDVVIPVFNEAADVARNVRRLRAYLDRWFPYEARVTIADNASSDGTWDIARSLAAELPGVRAIHMDAKGRGRALRAAWVTSDAEVLAYMDVDLSTGLGALEALVTPLLSDECDVAIGSRLIRGARVVRGPKRELISRVYNLLLRMTLGARFHDAQCGFKAVRADVARGLLPEVEDGAWFFDTELLVVAQRNGLRILEVPVDWVDDPDSGVDVVRTAIADLQGIWRLLRRRPGAQPPGLAAQLARFAAVGAASTAAYLALFSGLASVAPTAIANDVALLATAVANTAANRRITFGVRGRDRLSRDHAGGLAAFGLALMLTNLCLWTLQVAAPTAGRTVELAGLVAANLAATAVRFLLLRAWIHHPRRQGAQLEVTS